MKEGDYTAMPKVSVIIGVFNGAKGIESALASIKDQTYDDWECIICDDGSTDSTWEVLQRITEGDSRFVLLRNSTNRGLAASLNYSISMAKGEYLARQDADDVSYPTRFEEEVAFLEKNEGVSVVGTYAALFDSSGGDWGIWKTPEHPEKADWITMTSIIHPSVMMRKQDILDVGGYNEKALRVEDLDLWIKLIGKGRRIATLPKVLYNFHWDISDYSRRKLRYRWNELKMKYQAFRTIRLPFYYCVYLLKPVITGLMPGRLMYLYHLKKFRI
ncbi:MAG: glycosyltransferase [Thermodesulfobacteriota bacterium]